MTDLEEVWDTTVKDKLDGLQSEVSQRLDRHDEETRARLDENAMLIGTVHRQVRRIRRSLRVEVYKDEKTASSESN